MIETFNLIIVPKIRERMRQLYGSIDVNTQAIFEERLRDEYFNENTKRIFKRFFF